MIQIGGVYATFCQEEGILLHKSIAIEMGGVSRYFSKISGSGVDVTLLMNHESVPSGGASDIRSGSGSVLLGSVSLSL